MAYTVANQRVVTVHRERATSDFLGIKNENWQYAARDLGAHALLLYLYFASNRDNYTIALSPVAIRQAVGMPPQTYRDQFLKLVDKGYLVVTGKNRYNFYEVPKRDTGARESADELPRVFEKPSHIFEKPSCVENTPPWDREINIDIINNSINNNINKGLLQKQVSTKPQGFQF